MWCFHNSPRSFTLLLVSFPYFFFFFCSNNSYGDSIFGEVHPRMAYRQAVLDRYRADARANRPFVCTTCPYCNGSRDATVKHTHFSTKPANPWDFWRHVLLKKYRGMQSKRASENLARCLPTPAVDPDDFKAMHASRAFSSLQSADQPNSDVPPLSDERQFVVGPMVDQSELPFRMLCRQYGATLAYTPMLHARSFSEGAAYRCRFFTSTPLAEVRERLADAAKDGGRRYCDDDALVDRPCIVQFCGHEADTVLAAARYAVRGEYTDRSSDTAVHGSPSPDSSDEFLYHCDAVDINLGCPQGIARRGHYGSFLMEDWDLIHTIIHTLHVELEVPVTVKIRVFDEHHAGPSEPTVYDELLTAQYARMIRDAGAQMLCVHGRTREMKGQQTGLANMDLIRRVRNALGGSIPVLANGNVQSYDDVCAHLESTRCEGHMCAEPLLWDPALFSAPQNPVPCGRFSGADKQTRLAALQTAFSYVRWLRRCPVDLGFAKAHLFKMCFHSYELHRSYRDFMSALKTTRGAAENDEAATQQVECHEACEAGVVDFPEINGMVFEGHIRAIQAHLLELYEVEKTCTVEEEQPKVEKAKKAAARALAVDVFDEESLGINF